MKQCKHCENLEEMEWECPDDPHHGEVAYCPECNSEFYREYGGNQYACNEQAQINYPKMTKL